MKKNFYKLFKTKKPIIAMVHFPALPGTPLYDEKKGLNYIYKSIEADLINLQKADVDAVMFGNENDRPYELKVNPATLSTMSYMIGKLSEKITIPFGVNVLWDPISTIALAVSTKAKFVREIFTGTYASDMGIWSPNAGEAMRYRNSLGRKDIQMYYNISAERVRQIESSAIKKLRNSINK